MRPISIINFERCYLGALALGLLNTLLSWSTMVRTPQVAQVQAMFGGWYLPFSLLIGYGISLLLWYFTARRASTVGKWIITVFFAFGVIGLLFGFARAGGIPATSRVISIVALVLQGVAVYLLFRPDADAWFAGRGRAADMGETFR